MINQPGPAVFASDKVQIQIWRKSDMTTKKVPCFVVTVMLTFGFSVGSAFAQDQNQASTNQSTVSRQTVINAQHVLKGRGYYTGLVDGFLGSKTRAALEQFQKDHGLNPDGQLTQETAEHLGITGAARHAKSGSSAVEHFEQAGKAIGSGAKEFGKDVAKGKVGEAGKDFGKGVGGFAKGVGKGTAKATKGFFSKVADVFEGDDENQKDQPKPAKSTIINAQHVLKGQGYYSGKINGKMDAETREALKRFQQDQGLTVDGRLTKTTADKLGIVAKVEGTDTDKQ
jgi:peptidoglycan hydrolase-like protein with peptidoglycan-binding domain